RHGEDLRAFEWHYWNRQIHNERRPLSFKSTAVMAIRESGFSGGGFSNDSPSSWVMNDLGTRVACVSYDLGERRTDPETKAASATRTYFLEVYDTVDGQRLCRHQLLPENNGVTWLEVLVLSPDGSRAAIGWLTGIPGPRFTDTSARQIRVLDVATGKTLYDLSLRDQNNRTLAQAPFFCADGRLLAVTVQETVRQTFEARRGPTDAPTAHTHIIDLESQPAKELGGFDT